jgi:hypothetical protein
MLVNRPCWLASYANHPLVVGMERLLQRVAVEIFPAQL